MVKITNKAEEIATEHLLYIVKLLENHGEDPKVIGKIAFHYKTAFIHGWKHAKEHRITE